MRSRTARFAVAVTTVLTLVVGAGAVAAQAATTASVAPSPFAVPRADGAGNPQLFTVVGTGFAPGTPVYVEQCDGSSTNPTPPQTWNPNDHCDAATGNAPVNADSNGNAVFPAGNVNFRLTPFKGENPQGGLFNCIGPNDPPTNNGNTDWTTCKVRVTQNLNTSDPSDAYLNIVLPDGTSPSTGAGSCGGQVGVTKFQNNAKQPTNLTNQPSGIIMAGALLKNIVAKPAVALGGSCTNLKARTNDPNIPDPPATLTPKAFALKLAGNASCAPATTPASWPLTGTLTMTMTQTYNDKITGLPKSYQLAASITLQRVPVVVAGGVTTDVWNVTGVVTKGLSLGAKVGGSIWLDPVTNPKTQPSPFNTGYQLDSTAANACDNGTTASVGLMMFGGGGTSTTSPRHYNATGLTFTLLQ